MKSLSLPRCMLVKKWQLQLELVSQIIVSA